jgi:hypothetical protein
MRIDKFIAITLLFFITSFLFINHITAQEKKVAATSQDLYNEITRMDSTIFSYFNTRKFELFKAMFTKDLEWFQDNDGLITYNKVFANFKIMFGRPNKLTRQLVPGSLEVHPIKNYGAIEIGTHQFKHIENGKEEIGTFKFTMIWQKLNGQWKISRVISYDHYFFSGKKTSAIIHLALPPPLVSIVVKSECRMLLKDSSFFICSAVSDS